MNTRYQVAYRNISLEGHDVLRMEKVTFVYELVTKQTPDDSQKIIKRLIEENVKPLVLPLMEATEEQIVKCRKKGIPSFVLKKNGKFFWARIPVNVSLVGSNLLGTHCCDASGRVCQHVLAASDEAGGCEVIRNGSRYIEIYEWIPEGYETFKTHHDAFVVGKCLKHAKCPPKPSRTAAEVRDLRISLAYFYCGNGTHPGIVARKFGKCSNSLGYR